MPNNRYLWKEVAKRIEELKYPIVKCPIEPLRINTMMGIGKGDILYLPSYDSSTNQLKNRLESLGKYLIEHPIAEDWMYKYEELLDILPTDWEIIFPWDVVDKKLTIKDRIIRFIKRLLK